MDLWDPALPGAGAQRAMCIVQLYMRMGHYNPLAILIADSLCLTFKSDGATASELSDYLGLTPDRIEAGISAMPKEAYCTSAELSSGAMCAESEQQQISVNRSVTISNTPKSPQDDAESSAMRYYINYATLIPFAYAHTSHMLLNLCQLPLPKRAEGSGDKGEFSALNISQTLRRVDCRRGLCCMRCRYWMGLWDLRSTIVKCPLCQADVLQCILDVVKGRYEEKLASGQQLLVFGPVQQQQHQQCSLQQSKGAPDKPQESTTRAAGNDSMNCPLARDPFLVQQALFFKFLYSYPFVCVNDGQFVVDVDEVMTEDEYLHRSKHKATVLDQFRLVHRNAASIRVKLVQQSSLDEEKCMQSAMKLVKRMQLPPWLRTSTLQYGDDALQPLLDSSATVGRVAGSKRNRKGPDITSAAAYIAREYFDDDFDEVPLKKGIIR
uniref:Uncharacterized protein TCIL3000_11_14400 n=1 Tax=Trypanosoma congolense (strain IL3000) TaxID=1068625 RepID=G0V2Q3_TRYCI|nr:unnamed protein product [Trypanosoma congolense IL3000]